jgi:hypothetical protein
VSGPATIVAASFAAVSASLSLPWLGSRLHRLVLWNPVLDLTDTFVEPTLPWGKENFSSPQQDLLVSQGFLVVDGGFELGRVVFEEFGHSSGSPPILGHRPIRSAPRRRGHTSLTGSMRTNPGFRVQADGTARSSVNSWSEAIYAATWSPTPTWPHSPSSTVSASVPSTATSLDSPN